MTVAAARAYGPRPCSARTLPATRTLLGAGDAPRHRSHGARGGRRDGARVALCPQRVGCGQAVELCAARGGTLYVPEDAAAARRVLRDAGEAPIG